jgi:hypothetical protein
MAIGLKDLHANDNKPKRLRFRILVELETNTHRDEHRLNSQDIYNIVNGRLRDGTAYCSTRGFNLTKVIVREEVAPK